MAKAKGPEAPKLPKHDKSIPMGYENPRRGKPV